MRSLKTILLIVLPLFLTGCAMHYYDDKTGTEHIWGFGHMKMKVIPNTEGITGTVHGVNVKGIGFSKGPNDFSLIAGFYNHSRVELFDEDISLRLEWPTNDLFDARIGTAPPFLQKGTGQ